MAVLRALAVVAPDPIGPKAGARAGRLAAQGTPDPPGGRTIGTPEFVDAWMSEDPFGDQRMHMARFRYPGRDPHTPTRSPSRARQDQGRYSNHELFAGENTSAMERRARRVHEVHLVGGS
ncbi:MAG: hypothetical protein M3456_14900 [Actinomycetota bacterium]|nr:hypothetical protein [Actinomycetota bacterium]